MEVAARDMPLKIQQVPMPDQLILELHDTTAADLPTLFVQQLDPAANHMAAFTAPDPTDEAAFLARWARLLADESVLAKTIRCNGQLAGHIVHFIQFDQPAVSYWLGRAYWGQGIATRALAAFVHIVQVRPLYARAAHDNSASIRVLQKCGFKRCGSDSGFAAARGAHIAEVLLKLDAPAHATTAPPVLL
jgi:RimJ/RimL family protein N-acetyltransferase